MAQTGKNLPAMQETWVLSLGREDPLAKGMAALSNIVAWRIPWTEDPGGYSPWGRKGSDTTSDCHFTFSLCGPPWPQPHPAFSFIFYCDNVKSTAAPSQATCTDKGSNKAKGEQFSR